jgi:hypothetical protein
VLEDERESDEVDSLSLSLRTLVSTHEKRKQERKEALLVQQLPFTPVSLYLNSEREDGTYANGSKVLLRQHAVRVLGDDTEDGSCISA